MWINKIKSLAVTIIFGFLTFIITGLVAMKLVANEYNVTLLRAIEFGWNQHVKQWPIYMTLYLGGAIILAVGSTLLIWCVLANHRWKFQIRRIDGYEAISELMSRSEKKKNTRIFGGRFGGKVLYASVEDRGLVIGPPGTGKTAFLFNQILRSMKSGLSFVVIDLKPELHRILAPSLEKSGYRVLRINPAKVDCQADHWNPLEDIKDETAIVEMCSALLPIRDAKEAPFIEAQRDWLKAAVFHVSSVPGGSLASAYNLLSEYGDPLKLLEVLMQSTNSIAARLGRRMYAGMTAGKDPLVLQGLSGALRGIDYLGLNGVQDALGHSDFSVMDLGKGEQATALFLQFEENKINALGPLLAFMATGIITALIGTAGERRPVALFLDELGNMPPIPNLPEKLNTIRSRHIPTWMYFQTAEQMNIRYGKGADEVFFASADMQIVFRLNDQMTRERISKLVGTTEKVKITINNNGQARTRERVNVIEPYQLGKLKKGEVVALYRGAAAKGRATPHYIDFPEFYRK